jgi:hypothetical protein
VAGLVVLLIIVALLMVLDALALTEGVDSRDWSTDPRGPTHPVGIS